MSSYRYEQPPFLTNGKGGRSWSDGYCRGTYNNATGYSFDNGGGGSMAAGASDKFGYSSGLGSVATSAKGQFWSGGYSDGYGSNDFGGGQWRGGRCTFQSYSNNVRIFACSVVPSYQIGDAPVFIRGSDLMN